MVSQLNDDILHCGWLCQIVRLQNPAFTDRKCLDYAVNAVLLLHRERTIVVGDTLDIEGMICIQPWPDSNEDLRIRLRSAVFNADDQDRSFCFWIQLQEHFGA